MIAIHIGPVFVRRSSGLLNVILVCEEHDALLPQPSQMFFRLPLTLLGDIPG